MTSDPLTEALDQLNANMMSTARIDESQRLLAMTVGQSNFGLSQSSISGHFAQTVGKPANPTRLGKYNYGVDKSQFPNAKFETRYFVYFDSDNGKPSIEEFYIPLQDPDEPLSSVVISFPMASFVSRDDAQRALIKVVREIFKRRVSELVEDIVKTQIVDGVVDDPEIHLADALRTYIAAVGA
jgi:hypothetical protein